MGSPRETFKVSKDWILPGPLASISSLPMLYLRPFSPCLVTNPFTTKSYSLSLNIALLLGHHATQNGRSSASLKVKLGSVRAAAEGAVWSRLGYQAKGMHSLETLQSISIPFFNP